MTGINPEPMGEARRLVRAYLYGEFGQGKTTQIGKLTKVLGGKTLIVTTDSNWSVLTKDPDISNKIDMVRYMSTGHGNMMEGKLILYGMIHEIVAKYGDGEEYNTLAIDTINTVVDITRIHLTKKFNYLKDQRLKDASSWTHFNILKDQMLLLRSILTESNLHIIFTSQEREPSDEDIKKGKFRVRPNSPEGVFKILAEECNVVGHCYRDDDNKKYMLQTQGTKRLVAKSQIPTLPQAIFKADDVAPLIGEWVNG